MILAVSWFSRPTSAEDFAYFHENVMGTSLELRVRADRARDAVVAESRVLAEIDRLSRIFSGYDSATEFSRWQATKNQPTRVSDELFEVLARSDFWLASSGGAFDPRAQALTALWTAGARDGVVPSAKALAEAKRLMSRPAWRLDEKSRTAERLTTCPISLNAIAKGAIVERACDAAFQAGSGIHGLLLNVGGDLRVRGDMDAVIGVGSPWKDSETTEPIAHVSVRDRAVATSGDYHRGAWIQGKWYSHIFDPRTGLPAGGISSATVIAERSLDADALATTLNVLTPEESLRLIKTVPGVDCMIVATDGKVWRSAGWDRYEQAALGSPVVAHRAILARQDEKAKPAASPAPAGWGANRELVVNFEISPPEGNAGRYRRPYVVIWVEDKAGHVVRNLILWVSLGGSGPERWLPDLKRWYRADQARKDADGIDMVHTIGRSTRPSGAYSVIWDGLDDDKKPVAPGTYTIHIEAAREHGTYQSIRKEVTLGDKPFAEELKGNVEIRSASLEFRARTPAKPEK